ncbi:MAG: glycosyltransferase [Oscillospiraceae bacterium]|jgi:glycosyltransferase involved in cell wall biosynthesis|nr:glycosyltransferase [Oscillospiraceae bacterium]
MSHPHVSVLLAACCGKAYIAEQIASILPQLHPGDELLISDDSPAGDAATKEAVQSFGDPRIHYLAGPRQGVVKNIEFLLGQARGGILVLSDQDDVWLPGKLACARAQLRQNFPALLHHNAKVTDARLQITNDSLWRQNGARPGHNLLRNGYTGCCMAFNRALLPYLLPFPEHIPMHDQWIGLRAEQLQRRGQGVVRWVAEPYLLYRRHAETQTGHGSSLLQKLKWRFSVMRALSRSYFKR